MAGVYIATPVDGGRRGPMYVGDLVSLIRRNLWKHLGMTVIDTRFGARGGAPPDTCTLHIEAVGSPMGSRRNLGAPFLPENTIVEDPQDPQSRMVTRGWRDIIATLISGKKLKPTAELREVLGPNWSRHAGL